MTEYTRRRAIERWQQEQQELCALLNRFSSRRWVLMTDFEDPELQRIVPIDSPRRTYP